MFPKGRASQVMIGVLFLMSGLLIGLAVQPSGWGLDVIHGLIVVIFVASAVLALDRHSQDEFDRGAGIYKG